MGSRDMSLEMHDDPDRAPEPSDAQGRGAFYESAGCRRDVVQNHLFQKAAHLYQPGSWGPQAGDALIAADGGWHNPEPMRDEIAHNQGKS
jgi:glucose-6-phosphate 1-dehydrogenase